MSHSADVLVPKAKADQLMKAAKMLTTHLAMYGAPAPVFAGVTEILLNLFHSGFKLPPDNDTSPASSSGSSSAASSSATGSSGCGNFPIGSSAAAARAFFIDNPVRGELSEDPTSRKPVKEERPRNHRRQVASPKTPPKAGPKRTAVKTIIKPEPRSNTAKHGAFSRRNYLLLRGSASSAQAPDTTRREGGGVNLLRRPMPPPPSPRARERPSSQLRR